MGLLDHRKTWHFSVNAPPNQCLQAFETAMIHPGFKLLAAKWHLERGDVSAVLGEPPWHASIATYQGRGGAVGVLTDLMGGMAEGEEQAAVGSQVTFALNPNAVAGRTECSMWLSQSSTKIGFTNDARFLRSSMSDVEKQLRLLDPGLIIEKA